MHLFIYFQKLCLGPHVVIVIVMTAKSKLGNYRLFSFFPEIHLLGALSGKIMFCDCNPEYTQLDPLPNKRFF